MKNIKLAFMYIYFKILEYIQYILYAIGYIRIYDIEKGDDITYNYNYNKYYAKIGVCRYLKNKYVRYICYNMKLSDIRYMKLDTLNGEKYFDIKKIEINNTDITEAKANFYNLDNNYVDIGDIIKFYQILNNINSTISSIKITKETFDDEIMEFITTTETINI